MKSVLEVLESGTDHLAKKGVADARLSMQYLVAKVLDCVRIDVYMQFDRPLEEGELVQLRELLKRRASGEPLQHILGTVEFCGREFICDSRGLIPRPETEELAEILLKRGGERESLKRVLDVGCGSGVLGLTLAAGLTDLSEAVLVDVSPDALELAKENAEALEIDSSILTFLNGDLFTTVEGMFDLVVANLPYISPDDLAGLSVEVQHDPVLALDGGGDEGLAIMERFIAEVPNFLSPNGLVAMEFGMGQAESLSEFAAKAGLREIEIAKDACGIDRFLFAVGG